MRYVNLLSVLFAVAVGASPQQQQQQSQAQSQPPAPQSAPPPQQQPTAFVAYFLQKDRGTDKLLPAVENQSSAAHAAEDGAGSTPPWLYVILPPEPTKDSLVILVPDLPVFKERQNVEALEAALEAELHDVHPAASVRVERVPRSAVRRRKDEKTPEWFFGGHNNNNNNNDNSTQATEPPPSTWDNFVQGVKAWWADPKDSLELYSTLHPKFYDGHVRWSEPKAKPSQALTATLDIPYAFPVAARLTIDPFGVARMHDEMLGLRVAWGDEGIAAMQEALEKLRRPDETTAVPASEPEPKRYAPPHHLTIYEEEAVEHQRLPEEGLDEKEEGLEEKEEGLDEKKESLKEEILKDEAEILKGESLKTEILKEEILKDEILKDEILKDEILKGKILKGEILKDEFLIEEIPKEELLLQEVLLEGLTDLPVEPSPGPALLRGLQLESDWPPVYEQSNYDSGDVSRLIQRAVKMTPAVVKEEKKKPARRTQATKHRRSEGRRSAPDCSNAFDEDDCALGGNSNSRPVKSKVDKIQKRRMKEERKAHRKERANRWETAVDLLENASPAIAPSGARKRSLAGVELTGPPTKQSSHFRSSSSSKAV